jgi:hypothetical protein
MEMIVAGDIAEAQNMLQAISIMYGRDGGEEEPFESRDERKKLMERFLSRALPTGGRYVGGPGSRDRHDDGSRGGSRLRGSLTQGSRDDRPAIRAPVIDDGREEPHRGGTRRSADPSPEPSARDQPPRRQEPSGRRDPDADGEA